jgi:hypothetical protein
MIASTFFMNVLLKLMHSFAGSAGAENLCTKSERRRIGETGAGQHSRNS